MKKNTTAEIVAFNWTFSTENQFSYEQILTAAALEQVKATKEVNFTLKQILSRLDYLGNDGIHDVVRDMAQQLKELKKRRARDAKRRRLKVAA